jgi:hypothetical protein
VAAAKLKKGEHLKTANGTVAIADGGTTPKVHDGWMWDLTIPGNYDHDFYVVAESTSMLVHNNSCINGPLYRGVWPTHPDYEAAQNGDAVPTGWGKDGPKLTPEQHNGGVKGLSDFTSWTTNKALAIQRSQGGVVLRIDGGSYPTVESPDYFDISEVLVYGPVIGADVLP